MPKVSVIIPTYNREALISRALDSVLVQTFTDYEIIVVDDGSKDHTQDILKTYKDKIKYLYQNNGGISSARNLGIKEASGQYIAFLDSDDYWSPEKLSKQAAILESNPRVGIVYGRMPIINEKGETLGTKPNGISGKNYKELLEVWGDLPTSSVMTRKECFERLGTFDENLPPMEDIDMWLRIARHYDLYEIEGSPLAYYWRHSEQITQDPIKVYSGLVKVHAKILKVYEDIPRDLILRKLVSNQYLLSRNYYFLKNYSEALKNIKETLIQYPLVGILFKNPNDNLISQCIKIIKPYIFLFFCQIKLSFSILQRSRK